MRVISRARARCSGRAWMSAGAAEALLEKHGPSLPAVERAEWERALSAVARALGEPEFRAAETEGRSMTLNDAVMLSASEKASGEPGRERSHYPQRLGRHETA